MLSLPISFVRMFQNLHRFYVPHNLGRLGILERENAAILNASLGVLAVRVVYSMKAALKERRIKCPFYISQNDGTLMSADYLLSPSLKQKLQNGN